MKFVKFNKNKLREQLCNVNIAQPTLLFSFQQFWLWHAETMFNSQLREAQLLARDILLILPMENAE
jgi:low temperature requirement protein LtrA